MCRKRERGERWEGGREGEWNGGRRVMEEKEEGEKEMERESNIDSQIRNNLQHFISAKLTYC